MSSDPFILSFMVLLAGGVASRSAGAPPDVDLQTLVRNYSAQRIVELNAGESYSFKLRSGAERVIRLVSVKEQRDSVVNLVRRAEVRVEIDGRPVDLVCAPYVMPTETAGLRVQADTTSGWGNITKQAQLSIWDATDPIVDTKRFVFPIRNYRLFCHGTQAYDEPVHLGAGDDAPEGQRFYHDYGFDMAGFEGRDEVISAVEGKVVAFWPSREDLCSVLVQDRHGMIWEFAHLKAVESDVVLDAQLAPGRKIGLLGRSGPSGNFSHLHVGLYLTRDDLDSDSRTRRLNLFPWLVTAYQARYAGGVFAIARPHQMVLTGEKAVFDGGNSLAFGGGKIVEWRWVFPDGATVKQAKAEKVFERPGAYVVELWVKDSQRAEDVDFCQVKVFSKSKPEKSMPHIFMTCTPTQDVRPNQPVTFRFWPQGEGCGSIKVEFDDGTQVADYQPYAELQHSFKTPGLHIVTVRCEAGGKPIMQKLKVVVSEAAGGK